MGLVQCASLRQDHSEEKPAELESNWAAAGGCLSVCEEDFPGRQHKTQQSAQNLKVISDAICYIAASAQMHFCCCCCYYLLGICTIYLW